MASSQFSDYGGDKDNGRKNHLEEKKELEIRFKNYIQNDDDSDEDQADEKNSRGQKLSKNLEKEVIF